MNVISTAMHYANAAHTAIGQKRKYTNEEYFEHPKAVANTLKLIDAPHYVIAAGFLHDVVEDTAVTFAHLAQVFEPMIVQLVREVTDVSRPEDGNREMRKEIDRIHLSQASYWGKTIKLADLIDNTSSITQHDPHFAKVYMAEKERLLMVLTNGHPDLYSQALKILQAYQRSQIQKALSPYAA